MSALLTAAVLVFVLIGACLPAPVAGRSSSTRTSCTKPPALVENWKKAVAQELGRSPGGLSVVDVVAYATSNSDGFKTLPNPFKRVAGMSDAERRANNERVLREDERVMVLVDKYVPPPAYWSFPRVGETAMDEEDIRSYREAMMRGPLRPFLGAEKRLARARQ